MATKQLERDFPVHEAHKIEVTIYPSGAAKVRKVRAKARGQYSAYTTYLGKKGTDQREAARAYVASVRKHFPAPPREKDKGNGKVVISLSQAYLR